MTQTEPKQDKLYRINVQCDADPMATKIFYADSGEEIKDAVALSLSFDVARPQVWALVTRDGQGCFLAVVDKFLCQAST